MIEELRQNARLQAAAEAEREAVRASNRRGRFGALRLFSPKAIIAHPRLATILGVWGAALLGLSVLALSSVDIARISMVAGLGALGHFAKFVFSAIAAVIGGAGGFVVARALGLAVGGSSRRASARAIAHDEVHHDVRPIDPAELGSDSLDAPLEENPFGGSLPSANETAALEEGLAREELAREGGVDQSAPIEALAAASVEHALQHGATHEAKGLDAAKEDVFELNALTELDPPHGDEVTEDEPSQDSIGLVSSSDPGLRIDAFREILNEETRKYEERQKAAGKADSATISLIKPPPPLALAKLRQSAPQDLSLMQLVERFAAALHEVQERSPGELATDRMARESAERERALAEALKALELFTDRSFDTHGFNALATRAPSSDGAAVGTAAGSASTTISDTAISETERDLRDALTKLQTLRGAA